VLTFTAVASLVTGVLFGLAPALRTRRMQLFHILKEGGRAAAAAGSARPQVSRYLLAGQVALSVLVLFTCAVLVRSLRNLERFDTGYRRDNLLLLKIDGNSAGYADAQWIAARNELLERLRHIPGATAATYSNNGLFSGSESADGVIVEGFTATRNEDKVSYDDSVGPNYFATIGVPVIMGRDIGPQDTATSPRVCVINEEMARFYFHGADPVGRHIALDDDQWRDKPYEIVGVAQDVHDHELRQAVHRRFYMPMDQTPAHLMGGEKEPNYIVRASGNPSALLDSARKTVHDFNSNLWITHLDTANALIDQSLTDQIAVANLSGLFAGLALLLACVGLYGLMSYSVAGRTREIGVRMALGATRSKLIWLVLREAMTMVVVGVLVGVPIAIAASRALHSMLFEVTPVDPLSLALTALVLSLVAAFAAFLPARRATRVDPMVALRYE
jgi:predicted permease